MELVRLLKRMESLEGDLNLKVSAVQELSAVSNSNHPRGSPALRETEGLHKPTEMGQEAGSRDEKRRTISIFSPDTFNLINYKLQVKIRGIKFSR